MSSAGVISLIAGGALTAGAALAHLACIALGPRAYRFMGAGERMARAVESGHIKPTLITVAIATLLLAWAAYAFAGAGVIPRLPLTPVALYVISAIYLARAVAFPLLKPAFPENTATFWLVSSSICLLLGFLYGFGAVTVSPAP